MTQRVHIVLLGAPRVEQNGSEQATDTRKATAMLAYLAVTKTAHTREALAALLWPDFDERHARAALRRTLSVLKRAVGEATLDVTRHSLALVAERVYVDVHEFTALADSDSAADWMRAVALYQDDFMAGFTLRDAPPFDEWHYFQVEAQRRRYALLLARLAQHCAARADFAQAIEFASRWLALDPLQEEAHCTLMRLYAWGDQRSAALQQYRTCVRILEEELGVTPLEATTELYNAIRNDTLAAPATPLIALSAAGAPPPEQPLPLVGRAREWTELGRAHLLARDGLMLLTIEGEAGIGKSRLAEAFATWAVSQGSPLLWLNAWPGTADLAYEPFADGLRRALEDPASRARLTAAPDHWLVELLRLLPELRAWRPDLPPPEPLSQTGAQARFFEALAQSVAALLAAPAGQPGLLVLDDANRADDASLDLLAYLTRRLARQPLLIFVLWRSEAVPADHRLRQLAGQVLRNGYAGALTLARWGADDVRALIAQAGLDLPAERLFVETEGVPYFVAEFVRARQTAGSDWTLPPTVRDLLRARVAEVGGAAQQVLQAAAVIGRAVEYDVLRAAGGRSEDETVTALDSLLARGLLRARDGHTLDFSHDKLRRYVYDELNLIRRRLLHRRVADVLAEQARRHARIGAQAALIAAHYRQAGQDGEAADYYRHAGDHARALYANREALQAYELALALGHPQAATLHEACGDLQMQLGNYPEAIGSLERAAASAEPASAALVRLEHKLGRVQERRGHWQLAERHFEAARDLAAQIDLGAAAQADLFTDWSRLALRRNDLSRAQALAAKAFELAEAAGEAPTLARAHNAAGMLARRAGDLVAAQQHLDAGLAAILPHGSHPLRVALLNNLALVLRDRGQPAQAQTALHEALALCAKLGDRHREAALRNNLADLLHQAGDETGALAELKVAVRMMAEVGGAEAAQQPEIWKLTEF